MFTSKFNGVYKQPEINQTMFTSLPHSHGEQDTFTENTEGFLQISSIITPHPVH